MEPGTDGFHRRENRNLKFSGVDLGLSTSLRGGQPKGLCLRGYTRRPTLGISQGGNLTSGPLDAPEGGQRRHDHCRPPRDFVLAQGSLGRLESGAQQDRILAGRD